MREKIYYVYRHVRLDTNEVFYIGKGTGRSKGKSERSFYIRAYNKSERTNYWLNIAKKSQYIVEILFQSKDLSLILDKEREFIKFYGRKDLGQGTLVNLADGGDGPSNALVSEATHLKMKRSSVAKFRIGKNSPVAKPLFVYKTDGTFYKRFDTRAEAVRELNVTKANLHSVLRGDYQQISGWVFKNRWEGDYFNFSPKPRRGSGSILHYDLNMNFIQEFRSSTEASQFFGCSTKKILSICRRKIRFKDYILSLKI